MSGVGEAGRAAAVGGPRAGTETSAAAAAAAVAEAGRPLGIALFGLFGCGNLGNDGSLESMLRFLRRERPEARLVCICDRPDVVGPAFALSAAPISWSRRLSGRARRLDRLLLKIPGKAVDLVRALRSLRGVDVMIVPGTGILDDFGERPYGMPFDLFMWCAIARLRGIRIAMVSIGAGPIHHPLSRRLMLAAAGCAHYRSYRDEISRAFMESLGFDTTGDLVFPDLAFALEAPGGSRSGSGPLVVGIGVMSYFGWYGFAPGGHAIFDAYVGKIAGFVAHLLDAGHDVRLLTGEAGDATAVDRVRAEVARLRPQGAAAVAFEPVASLAELMGQIALTDVVVATRFHNVVCALRMGRPTISLGYARKNDVLMAEAGLEAFCRHVERFETEELIELFARLIAEREVCARRVAVRCEELRSALEGQEARLVARLL